MTRRAWHVRREGALLTVARHWPARFDVAVETTLPHARRERLAQQIRQDVWRAVQRQRGFSPVVEVATTAGGVRVRAGGRVSAAPFDRSGLEARIAAVLDHPGNRARWMRCAGRASK